MVGMDERVTLGAAGQIDTIRGGPQRLGDTLLELMESQLSPKRAKFGQVAQVWQQLLPAELRANCRIASLQGGRLKILAKSPAHLFELRLCSCALIKELAVRCPQAKIQTIDVAVG
jgi:hypothetical protein